MTIQMKRYRPSTKTLNLTMGFIKSFFKACKKRFLKFFRSRKNKKSKTDDRQKPSAGKSPKTSNREESLNKTLGVRNNATIREIREGYLKKCFEHHPDRHSNASNEVKQWNEEKFKLAANAYNILSMGAKKGRPNKEQKAKRTRRQKNHFNQETVLTAKSRT